MKRTTIIIVAVLAALATVPAASQAARRYGGPDSCNIDPYRLTTYTTAGWYHVAGDAAQQCFGGVIKQTLFVQLWEYWQSTDQWVKEGEGPVSSGGANQTIFAGDEVGCGSNEIRYWSMHAHGAYMDPYGNVWYQVRYRNAYLACRN